MHTQNTNQPSAQQDQVADQQPEPGDFFAQPFNDDAEGFYFSTEEEFEQKSSQCLDAFGSLVEEFEIQLIDGSMEVAELFDVCLVDQSNIGQFIAIIENVPEDQLPALFYLCDAHHYSMKDAINKLDDVTLYCGGQEDAAEELFDECYAHKIPEEVRNWIDYKACANDLQQGGDMCEFEFAGNTFTCTNANHV